MYRYLWRTKETRQKTVQKMKLRQHFKKKIMMKVSNPLYWLQATSTPKVPFLLLFYEYTKIIVRIWCVLAFVPENIFIFVPTYYKKYILFIHFFPSDPVNTNQIFHGGYLFLCLFGFLILFFVFTQPIFFLFVQIYFFP